MYRADLGRGVGGKAPRPPMPEGRGVGGRRVTACPPLRDATACVDTHFCARRPSDRCCADRPSDATDDLTTD